MYQHQRLSNQETRGFFNTFGPEMTDYNYDFAEVVAEDAADGEVKEATGEVADCVVEKEANDVTEDIPEDGYHTVNGMSSSHRTRHRRNPTPSLHARLSC